MRHLLQSVVLACGLFTATAAGAQGFAALVSPPRFEDQAKPGTTYRNVVEISNVSNVSAHYSLRTADWQLDPEGGASFSDALAPGSCRPWVGIEAAEITIAANGKRRYRFEVAVPADAPSGECRFGILLEGDPDTAKGAVPLPVTGRIGIIVYLTVGDAAASLAVTGSRAENVAGRELPVLQVRNAGNAHGRLEGLVDGIDANGHRYSFAPSNLPILAGETRGVALTPELDNPDAPAPTIAYPLKLKGRLDWGSQRIDIDTSVKP